MIGLIEHADALEWLARQAPDSAKVIIWDPPNSRYKPMRGREDGAAGSIYAPFSFMHRTLQMCARVVQPKGIVVCFGDWRHKQADADPIRFVPPCANTKA